MVAFDLDSFPPAVRARSAAILKPFLPADLAAAVQQLLPPAA